MNPVSAIMQFDTLDYARKLESAGVPGPQAELQAKALGEALGRAAASPRDLVTLENSLTANAAAVESRLNARIDTLRQHVDARIDGVEARIDAVEARIDGVESRIDTLKDHLEARIDALKDQVEARIDALKDYLETRIDSVEARLNARIDAVKLELGGKIETLKWMFGVLVALNVGILIRLLAIH